MIEKKITDYLEGFIYDDYSIRIESKSNGNKIFISNYEIDNLLEFFKKVNRMRIKYLKDKNADN